MGHENDWVPIRGAQSHTPGLYTLDAICFSSSIVKSALIACLCSMYCIICSMDSVVVTCIVYCKVYCGVKCRVYLPQYLNLSEGTCSCSMEKWVSWRFEIEWRGSVEPLPILSGHPGLYPLHPGAALLRSPRATVSGVSACLADVSGLSRLSLPRARSRNCLAAVELSKNCLAVDPLFLARGRSLGLSNIRRVFLYFCPYGSRTHNTIVDVL